MQLCAITNCKRLAPGNSGTKGEASLERQLRGLAAGWIGGGVDFIQLREKDLDASALRRLAAVILAGTGGRQSKFLINLPVSPASLREVAPVADGVHIPGRPVPGAVESVRKAFRAIGRQAIVSLSCHTLEEVRIAREEPADLVFFAPVFDKAAPSYGPEPGVSGVGLGMLQLACEAAREMPVFALGGVTAENASLCIAAGAVGVAGIRLFAGDDWRLLRAASCAEPVLHFRARRPTDI